MNLELINWLKDGKYRIPILKVLNSNPLLSSDLAEKMAINRASMSRILKKMRERALIEDHSGNSRTVTYSITKKGEEVLKNLK